MVQEFLKSQKHKFLRAMGKSSLLFFPIALFACVSPTNFLYSETEPPFGSPEFAEIPRVLLQICIPDKTVSYEDIDVDLKDQPVETSAYAKQGSPQDVRIKDTARKVVFDVRPTDIGIEYSDINYYLVSRAPMGFDHGGGKPRLYDTTNLNQPIYEDMMDRRQEKIVTFGVITPGIRNDNVGKLEFWYVLPEKLSSNKFTQWQNPIAKNRFTYPPDPYQPWAYITQGKELPPYAPDKNAIKVRYRLMSYQDYGLKQLYWNRTYKALFYKFKNGLTDEEKNKLVYVKKQGGEVADGC